MTQVSLEFSVIPNAGTRTRAVYDLLFKHRGEWIDGRELAKVGGYAGWSARCRDLRKHPFSMNIEQRDYLVERDGRKFTVTEYKLV
jgi:hypothetical protein